MPFGLIKVIFRELPLTCEGSGVYDQSSHNGIGSAFGLAGKNPLQKKTKPRGRFASREGTIWYSFLTALCRIGFDSF